MKKKVVWIILAVIVIVLATLGILYFKTDLFKSKEVLFYKHLAENGNLLGKTSYTEMLKQMKEEGTEEMSGAASVKITSSNANLAQMAEALEKGKIKYNIKADSAQNKGQATVTLNYNNNDIVSLDILKNNDVYGVKVAEAYDKYVSVENNNLKQLFQKFGVDTTNIPDKIEVLDVYELLNLDEETLKHIETTYTDTIMQNIPEESYSVEKNVNVNINGQSKTTNQYKLALTQEQVKTILIKMYETLRSDDKVLDLIVSKYDVIAQPYRLMGNTMIQQISKEDLVERLDETIEQLNNTLASNETMLEVIVYSQKDNSGKIQVNLIDDSQTVRKAEIDLTKATDEKQINVLIDGGDGTSIMYDVKGNQQEQNIQMVITANQDKVECEMQNKVSKNTSVEDLTTENSVKLNDMTVEEIQQLIQTIYSNVMQMLPQKAQALGISQ